MKRLITILLFPHFVFSQNLEVQWEQAFGGGNAVFHSVIEATNGYLVAVGETKSKTRGGSDGLLVIADYSTGQSVAEVRLGDNKDDVLFDVVQTFDGHFLATGSKNSIGVGGKDGWLVLVGERGEVVWETSFATNGDDGFRRLVLLPDGSAVLVGYQNGQSDGDIWLAKVEGKRMVWEKILGKNEFETISGLALATDGGFVFCGNSGKKMEGGTGNIYLAKTDAKGDLVWKKSFGEKEWEEALDLLPTRDGGFVLAGLTKSKGAGDLDAWHLKASRDGFRQWDKAFGGKDADLANAIIQTHDDGYLLAGSTKSHRSGARFPKGWAVQTSPGGDLQWEQHFGKDNEDEVRSACVLHDGSVVLAGKSQSLSGAAWLFRLADPQKGNPLAGMRDQVSLERTEPLVHTPDGTLKPGEETWLSFSLTNNTGMDLPDLRVMADAKTGGSDLSIWSTNYLGQLRKGESTAVRIPLRGSENLSTGSQALTISIASGTKTLQSFEKNIALRKPVPATLQIADYQFIPSGRSDDVTLSVEVENVGDFSSQAVEALFTCPAGVKVTGAVSQPMGIVAAKSRREVKLVFAKTAQFKGDLLGVVCVLKEAGQEKVRKTLEWQVQSGKSSLVASGPLMIWTDPAPHELGTNKIKRSDSDFDFKMTVVSPSSLTPKDFKLRVNGVEMEGNKFNEEELSPPKKENLKFTYTYKNKVPLVQGKNVVEVAIGDLLSESLEVEFTPERANLHLLVIGPNHEDLQYTRKDATDFANAFRNQGGEHKLFNQVFVHENTTPETTNLTGIQQAVYDFAYQWDDGQIRQHDLLIVFISSHGKIVDNRFKILQTGFNPKYERLAVDFKSDVLEVLNGITCKKLVFIDACHSGGAKEGYGGLSQAMIDLAKAQPGISTLTSCGSTEKSYEDKAWENGAFTEALLEAFAAQTCSDAQGSFSADLDSDGILRLGELYDFLRRRVPAMVKANIPTAPTTQTPFMPESQLDRGLPVFYLK